MPSKLLAWVGCCIAVVLSCMAGCEEQASNTAGGSSPVSYQTSHTVKGFVGGEKMNFLDNDELKRILAEKYDISVNPTKAGSVEMVTLLDPKDMDFLWPSNDIAVEFFRFRGGKMKKNEIVFNSPIVIYTGWNIANALIQQGIVEKRAEGYYIVKFRELLNMIVEEKEWKDLGLNFYGKITIRCTDPTRSNSGNMFCGLVANMFNDGDVVEEEDVATVLPKIEDFFGRLGMMEHSSGDIFRKFITTGINNSMVVGYENQIIEFILANPNSREQIENSVCVLYPVPTVWSSHPVISLNDNGNKLIEAMMDEEIQQLAWRDHGFRSGLVGVTIDPSAVNLSFMPEQIDSVMPLPKARAMERIVEELRKP